MRLTIVKEPNIIIFLQYIETSYMVIEQELLVDWNRLLEAKENIAPINFRFTDTGIELLKFDNKMQAAQHTIQIARDYITKEYGTGTDLCGYCIEASELIAKMLQYNGVFDARSVEGWCRFDDDTYGSDRPYDPHTWVEIPGTALDTPEIKTYYADITAEQFNPGMSLENEYPGIVFQAGLPHGMQYDEPTDW